MRTSMLVALLGAVLLSACFFGSKATQTLGQKTPLGETTGNQFKVENSFGNAWSDGGNWVIGGRKTQKVVALAFTSTDNGQTLTGWVTYSGEGSIQFRAVHTTGFDYSVSESWGGSWVYDGVWTLGYRDTQQVVRLDIRSPDGGDTFNGKMTYSGEGPIGFRASRTN